MHKTIYIDIDEEITSIVDSLRKANAREVVIVVPKRAMLIQSIVNLKLLKKEADSLKKEIVVVTQDKLGKLLVEKAGIEVEQKLDNISGKEVDFDIEKSESEFIGMGMDLGKEEKIKEKNRLENIGSKEFFDDNPIPRIQDKFSQPKNVPGEKKQEKIINTELVSEAGISLERKKSRFPFGFKKNPNNEFDSNDMIRKMDISQKGFGEEINLKNKKIGKKVEKRKIFQTEEVEDESLKTQTRTDKLEKYYSSKKPEKVFAMPKKSKKAFAWFGILAFLVIVGAAAYMFLPTATIKIFVKTKLQSIDVDVKGNTSASEINFQDGTIPAKLISRSEEVSKTFKATGKSGSSSQKAHGTITIYNEYSAESQPLVATTRLLTTDGKLFRLVKGVTIPGITTVAGEKKPGAIEAEVMADSSGEEFNVGPTTFSIPGFQGSGAEKYAKIYAKSSKAMTGGGSSGSEVVVISENDITAARNEMSQELKKTALENIKKEAGSGMTILDDAINLADSNYVISNTAGEAVSQFTLTGKTTASALAFSADDFKKIASRNLLKAASGSDIISDDSLKIEFGKSEVDFAAGTISIKANISGRMRENIDLDILKKGLAGKNEKELATYLSIYPEVENAEIEYHPAFIGGRIPSSEKRITLIVESK